MNAGAGAPPTRKGSADSKCAPVRKGQAYLERRPWRTRPRRWPTRRALRTSSAKRGRPRFSGRRGLEPLPGQAGPRLEGRRPARQGRSRRASARKVRIDGAGQWMHRASSRHPTRPSHCGSANSGERCRAAQKIAVARRRHGAAAGLQFAGPSPWGQWAVYPTPGSFFKYQLPPFQAAVDAGTSSIMCYYNNPSNAKSGRQFPAEWWQPEKQQFEEVAGAYNATLLGKLLRERMGFKGYINTDSGVLGNNAFGVEKLTLPERFAKAVKAGVSLFSDNNDPKGLIDAVNQHLLNEEDLNASVTYLLREMFHLGLFEEPYTDPEKAQAIANSPASAARADEAHRKSIVLLRNDKKLLPIKGARKIYVETFATGR